MALSDRQHSWTLERVAPLSGVAFAVLSLLGVALWSDLAFLDPPQDIAAEYVEDPGKVLAGSQTLAVAAFLLVWFGSSLHAAIRRAEGDESRLGALAFGGAVAAAGLMLAAAVVTAAVALRADDANFVDPAVAASLADVATVLLAAAAPVAAAVTTAATGLAALRSGRLFPVWLAWTSVVLTAGLLILPINWFVSVLFLVWAVIVGLLLYRPPPYRPPLDPPVVGSD
ncbi:MAG TPA: hypothetical protein VHE80_00750 [Acidimicrobiales bacterium]|nr:hypothetical protein [Acidimicrobiales bacterium]